MHDVFTDAEPIRLVFHNDDETPGEFVVELLRTVFGTPERDAIAFTSLIDTQGKAACGPYPPSVANALLEAAQQRSSAAGHRLLITRDAAGAGKTKGACDLCGALAPKTQVLLSGKTACLCGACVLAVMRASEETDEAFRYACTALDWHFAGIPRHQLVTTSREFPGHMRPDVQVAVDKLFASPVRFFGLHEEYRYQTLTFAGLMKEGRNPLTAAAVPRCRCRRDGAGEMSL